MELSKAPRLVLLTGRESDCIGTSKLGGGGGAAGGGGGEGIVEAPVVEGGTGEEGEVIGELAPEPAELFELLYFMVCSSPLSKAERLDFFRAKIFRFFFSSSEP